MRGTDPDITASRLPEEAPLLANRHDNTKHMVIWGYNLVVKYEAFNLRTRVQFSVPLPNDFCPGDVMVAV